MIKFAALRAKTYAYLMDEDSEKKKAKGTKKCAIKRYLSLLIIKIVNLITKPY